MASGTENTIETEVQTVGAPRWRVTALALTLALVLAGLVMIAAWALGFRLVGALENQALAGLLLILIGFTLSNLIQARWRTFAGWLLLAAADAMLLLWPAGAAQMAALAAALVGAGLVGLEFYQQYQRRKVR